MEEEGVLKETLDLERKGSDGKVFEKKKKSFEKKRKTWLGTIGKTEKPLRDGDRSM